MSSPWLRPEVVKGPLLWLLLAAGLLGLGRVAERTTRVEVYSTGGHVEVTVADSRLTAPVSISSVRAIEIFAMDSVDPPGGWFVEVEQAGRTVLRDRLPRRFHIPGAGLQPLGDWQLDDHAARGVVYRRAVDLEGDFTLRALFRGRFHHELEVVLVGEPTVGVALRRGLINNDMAVQVGNDPPLAVTSIDPVPSSDLLSAASVLLDAAATAALLIAVFALLAGVLASRSPGECVPRPDPTLVTVVVAGAAVLAAGLSAWLAGWVLEGLPHMPDSVTYLLQSRWLLHGRLYQDGLSIQANLDLPFTYVVDGRWLAQYPFGWPALLALGTAVGLPWLVAPLLGGAYVVLVYLLGRELFSPTVGALAAVLATMSPLARLLSGSMFPHAAAATLILLAAWLLAVARRSGRLGVAFGAGVAMGAAFGVRPVSALAVALPLGAFLLAGGDRARACHRRFALAAASGAGGALALVPTLLANQAVTGSPFRFAYALADGTMYGLANIPFGLRNMDALLASTVSSLYGWGWGIPHGLALAGLTLAFAWIPFLRGRPTSADWLLAGCFAALAVAYLGARAHGLHGFGARYYFEGFFALYLLTARGFVELARLGGPTADRRRMGPAAPVVVALAFALCGAALVPLPSRLALYRGYNHVDGSLARQVEALGAERALVIFAKPAWYQWAMAARLMDGGAAARYAFATLRGSTADLLHFFPDRSVYLWKDGRLNPYRYRPPGAPRRPPGSRRARPPSPP